MSEDWTSLSVKKETRKRVKQAKGVDEKYDKFINRVLDKIENE